jgi:hypothetical protein
MTTLQRISITVVTALVLGTLRASAGELPQRDGHFVPSSARAEPIIGKGKIYWLLAVG